MLDKNAEKIISLRLERTKAALEKNNMKVFIAQTKEEVIEIVKGLIKKGDVIGSGGDVYKRQEQLHLKVLLYQL